MMNPRNHVYDKLAQRAVLLAMFDSSYHSMKFVIIAKPLPKLNPDRLP